MSIKSVMPSNHLILCHPLLLLPSIFPSIGVFSNESALHIRWPKHWSFSFSISPSNEYSGLVSFGLTGLILLFREPSRVFSNTTVLALEPGYSCHHIKGFEMSCSGETCVIPLNLAPPKLVGPQNPLFRPTALHNLWNRWFTDPGLGSAGPHATATS